MGIETGASAPPNAVIVHFSSEELRRIIVIAAEEFARRLGDTTPIVLEALAEEINTQ